MIRLIRADMKRLRKKPALYILMPIVLLWLFLSSGDTATLMIQDLTRKMNGLGLLVPSIPVFLSLYGDEIKSGAIVTVIGRGLSRGKFIIAKLLDAFFMLLWIYLLEFVTAAVSLGASDLGASGRQYLFLALNALYALIKALSFFAVSSLVVFETWNSAGGLVVLVFNTLLLIPFLRGIQGRFTVPVYDLSLDGLLQASYNAFSADHLGWQVLPALILYIGLVVWLTIHRFNGKEIEL